MRPETGGSVLHAGGRPSAGRLHPVHDPARTVNECRLGRSGASRRADQRTGSQPDDQNSAGRPSSGPDRQPERDASKCTLANSSTRPSKRGKFVPTCSADTRVGTEEVTVVTNRDEIPLELAPSAAGSPGPKGFVVPPTSGSHRKSPSTTLRRKKANRRCSASSSPAKSRCSSKPKSPGRATSMSRFTIELPNTASEPGLSTLISRLINNGASTGNGTYINNPTTCFNPAEWPRTPLLDLVPGRVVWGAEPDLPARLHARSRRRSPKTPAPAANWSSRPVATTVPFTPGLNVNAGTGRGRLARAGDRRDDAQISDRRRKRSAGVAPPQSGRGAARRDGPQPVRLGRPRRMHRRPVQEGQPDLRQ